MQTAVPKFFTNVTRTTYKFFLCLMSVEIQCTLYNVHEPGHEKMCLMSYANNKGADQPAHLCSLISAFVFAA